MRTARPGTSRCRSGFAALSAVVVLAGCGSGSAGGQSDAIPSTTAPAEPTSDVDEIQRMVQCLAEAGVSASVTADGTGFSAEPGALEREQFLRIIDDCKERTGAGSTPPPQLSDDEISAVYDRWLETAACLTSEGYSVESPSTREAFIDGWATGDSWNPYKFLEAVSDAEFDRLNQVCPQ